jgi:hypothetical protein
MKLRTTAFAPVGCCEMPRMPTSANASWLAWRLGDGSDWASGLQLLRSSEARSRLLTGLLRLSTGIMIHLQNYARKIWVK